MESLAELNFETAVEARYAEKYAPAAADPRTAVNARMMPMKLH